MIYKWYYKTPEGFDNMYMNSDGEYLTDLWFVGSRNASKHIVRLSGKRIAYFNETCQWIGIYFSGENLILHPNIK